MKYQLFCFFFVLISNVSGQALRDVNYNYQYNPNESFSFHLKPVKTFGDGWRVYYKMHLNDSLGRLGQYTVVWELRKSLTDKEGVQFQSDSTLNDSGFITVDASEEPLIVAAKIINRGAGKAWWFYKWLSPQYPVNGVVVASADRAPVVQNYVNTLSSYQLEGFDTAVVTLSYYDEVFPPAAPGFSEALTSVPMTMTVDNQRTVAPGEPLMFSKSGLYLVQRDTAQARGFAVRAESDYPKYTTVENLIGPMIYICSTAEFNRLKQSYGEKRVFDRTVLSITGDKERAQAFMRNYFRRVELANRYFTSYKEGWKTDRGMVYIIFGLPEEVFLFNDREVWSYKSPSKVSFSFVRSPSLYDPDNYVLVRDRKYREMWYKTIDFWRNARF